jgi:ribosomal protein L44E
MDSPEAAREPWLDSGGCPKLNRRMDNRASYLDMHEHKAWRNVEIYARRCSGLTLKAISSEFRLSKETVREIARRIERKARWRAAQLRGELNEAASATETGVETRVFACAECATIVSRTARG